MKQEVLKGGTDKIMLGLKDHGRAVTPSSCSVRILQGTTVLASGEAPGGEFIVPASVVEIVREDLVADWTFTIGSAPSQRRIELFDVVLFKLFPVVSDADLIAETAVLASNEYTCVGEVSDPTALGFVDRALIGSREDWLGAILTMLSGADAGGQYVVTGFSPVTGQINYSPTTEAFEGDSFSLRRSFQGEIDAAWADIYDKLTQACAAAPDGSRPELIMTPDRLRRPHLLRALEKIFRGLADDPSGIDWARAEKYASEFEAVWNGLQLVFAHDHGTEPTPARETSAQWGFGR